jgi:hypothetical protein
MESVGEYYRLRERINKNADCQMPNVDAQQFLTFIRHLAFGIGRSIIRSSRH